MNFKPSKLVTYIENCTSAEILRSLAKRYGHNYDVMRAILLNEFVPVDVLEAQRPIHPELVHENPISLVLECLGRHGSGPELLGIRAEDLNKYHRVLHVIKEALSSPKDFRKYGATLELKALLSRKDLTLAQKLGLCGAEGANPRYRGAIKSLLDVYKFQAVELGPSEEDYENLPAWFSTWVKTKPWHKFTWDSG